MRTKTALLWALPATMWLAIMWLALATPALAYWPTTLDQNIPIAADPDSANSFPLIVPIAGDRTLITWYKQAIPMGQHYPGMCYQIIDFWGQPKFLDGPVLTQGEQNQELDASTAKSVADGRGGGVVAWETALQRPDPNRGIWAQKIDSSGNRAWGEAGVCIFPRQEYDFDVCADGQGGVWLSVSPPEPDQGWSDLYVQHINAQGQLLLGSLGVLVCGLPDQAARWSHITPDGQAGCYVLWQDSRNGPQNEDWYAQHLNSVGHSLWNPELLVYQNGYEYAMDLMWDGQNGVILEGGSGSGCNFHKRYSSAGQLLWMQDSLSWLATAHMAMGEPGYFYTTCFWYSQCFAQRVSVADGGYFWPYTPHGALMIDPPPGLLMDGPPLPTYRFPYLYAVDIYKNNNTSDRFVIAQALDESGQRQWGNFGASLAHSRYGLSPRKPVIDREGGCIVVFEESCNVIPPGVVYNVYLKRVNADGTLGGPFSLNVTLTPHNPPIVIPPQGGSFTFDFTIADTDSVGGHFDLWVVTTLPNGRSLEIGHRQHIPIAALGTFIRSNLQQMVPGNAPAGTYSYWLYAGNYAYHSPWGQDSFSFTKQGTGNRERVIGRWQGICSGRHPRSEGRAPSRPLGT